MPDKRKASRQSFDRIKTETLKKYAQQLTKVLFRLHKSLPDITSDQLWRAITARLTEAQVKKAITSNKDDIFIELFARLPVADQNGCISIDGELWTSFGFLKKELKICSYTVTMRVRRCRSRKGILRGRTCNFYALSDMRKISGELPLLPRADRNGTVKIDGKTWGTVNALSDILGLSQPTIQSRIAGLSTIKGLRYGKPSNFYRLDQVRHACRKLLAPMPQADKDGSFNTGKQIWMKASRLSRELGISEDFLQKNSQSIKQRKGKDYQGRILTFFLRSDAARIANKFLKHPIVIKDRKALTEYDGQIWGTTSAIGRELGISQRTIMLRLSSRHHPKIQGIAKGQRTTFYCLADARKVCADLLQDLPRAGKDGTFRFKGEVWGTRESFKRILKISSKVMRKNLQGARTLQGMDLLGRNATFYCLKDIQKRCKQLLSDLPRAGKDGTFRFEGEVWGTPRPLSRLLENVSDVTIRTRVKSLKGIKGRIHGRTAIFYRLTEVKEICADLLQDLPRAGKDGTFRFKGEVWGTINALSKRIGMSCPVITEHCKNKNVRKIPGRTANGIPQIFLSQKDVEKALKTSRGYQRLRVKKDPLETKDLQRHAKSLTGILFQLRRAGLRITSDQLWSNIKSRWSKSQLEVAIKTQSLNIFKALFT